MEDRKNALTARPTTAELGRCNSCRFLSPQAEVLNPQEVTRLDNVKNIRKIMGRAVISLDTANALGKVVDLLVDPLSGQLAGFSVQRLDGSYALASILDVHGIGPDAVMLEGDQSLVLVDASPLRTVPQAKQSLVGVKVLTEHGLLLGQISNLYLCIDDRPVFIYEVRSSLFDKLLGRGFYFAASLGSAFSDDGTSLIVTGDPETLDHRLTAAVERLPGPRITALRQTPVVHVEVRTHS
jgi:uncharacterized protein YrrD